MSRLSDNYISGKTESFEERFKKNYDKVYVRIILFEKVRKTKHSKIELLKLERRMDRLGYDITQNPLWDNYRQNNEE